VKEEELKGKKGIEGWKRDRVKKKRSSAVDKVDNAKQ